MEAKKRYNINRDSVSNIYSLFNGLGNAQYDPIETTGISATPRYSKDELMNAYRSVAYCRKVCDFLPKAMSRGWGKLILKHSEQIAAIANKSLNKLRNLYCRGQQLANLYGGAIVIRHIPDNRDYNEPVDKYFYSNNKYARTEEIQYSRIYNPWEVYPYIESGNEDVFNPEFYQLTANTDKGAAIYRVHRDRVIRFRGANTDYETMKLNRGFEDSLLIPFIPSALRYLSAINYVGASVTSFEFIVHKLDNLFAEIESEDTQQSLADRLRVAHQAVSSLRGLVIDRGEEEVEIVSRNYSGIKDVLEALLDEMVATSGLTKPQFIQEHPSGLASTGESERLAEADTIRALQIEKWGDQIEEDCKYQLWLQGYYREDWEWEWSSLFQQTPLEEADVALKLAQAKSTGLAQGGLL